MKRYQFYQNSKDYRRKSYVSVGTYEYIIYSNNLYRANLDLKSRLNYIDEKNTYYE